MRMVSLPRSAATGFAALALSLAFPAAAAPAGPLPDAPALPAVPEAPTVGVTPGGGGATVDAGVGDTTLQVGAGTGGVSVKRGTRGGSGAGNGAGDSTPVSIPTLRPGRNASRLAGGGPSAVLFGPSAGGRARQATRRGASGSTTARRAAAKGDPRRIRNTNPQAGGPSSNNSTHVLPFFELVDHIPGFLKAGIAALALVALAIWAAWVRSRRRFARNAFVDPVTGIANAPAFEGLLGRELERARRYKRPLALVVLDVSDARQSVLPLLDQTLRDVTRAIQEKLRSGDIVARLGHSRFAVICPEATATSGETLARALESRFEEMRVHAVVGMAERQPTDLGPRDILARAEAQLGSTQPTGAAATGDRRRALLKVA